MDADLIRKRLAEMRVSAGGTPGRDAARAEIDAELGVELAQQLTQLTTELGQLRGAVTDAATGSSRQAAALVRWTKWYVVATFVLVFITGCYVYLTYRLVKNQIEPDVAFDLGTERTTVAIENSGVDRVVDVRIEPEATTFLGPPLNQPVVRQRLGMPMVPGSRNPGWWDLPVLDPGEAKSHPTSDAVEQALKSEDSVDAAKKAGKLLGIPRDSKAQVLTLISFHVTYHRDVDHRRYTVTRVFYLQRDPKTGKPSLWDAELVFGTKLESMIRTR